MPARARGRVRRDLNRRHPFGTRAPQHAVLYLVQLQPRRDIRQPQHDEHERHDDGEGRPAPGKPPAFSSNGVQCGVGYHL